MSIQKNIGKNTIGDNIYLASIYLNKYFDKRLARTAHRFDVNIPDVFAETKAQRAIYDMFYLNATASSASTDQRTKAVGLLEEHFIIDSRSKGIYLGFVDSRGLPAYILLDELEETQTLDYSKEYSTGESTNRESQALFYRDWETDRKSTRLNSSHSAKSRMPSSA